MIVVGITKDVLTIVEEASFEDEYLTSIAYVSFQVDKTDVKHILDGVKYLRESKWDKVSRFMDHEWFDYGEEEGCYPNISNLTDSEHRMDGGQVVVFAGGDGYVNGFEKHSGASAFSHSFSWWPIIGFFYPDMYHYLNGEVFSVGPWAESQIGVTIDPLTGYVTERNKDCAPLPSSNDSMEIRIDLLSGGQVLVPANKVDDKWRIDENVLFDIQSEYGARVKKFLGY